jgi:hypothetical protein
MRVWVSVAALLIFYLCLHALALPPDGFVAGDQGTKLLQTQATLAHGPFSPWIDGPSQDLDTRLQYQEPFLIRREGSDHLVGVFPWILPALTAPLYWLLGFSGLYVVPAVSIGVTFIAAQRLGQKLGTPARGLWSAWCAVAATPVVFYGAEFWEHAPAVALTTSAVALASPDFTGDAAHVSQSQPVGRVARDIVAGAAIGTAAAFRPEAAVVLPAIIVAVVAVLPDRGLTGSLRAWRRALALALGWALVTALTIPANAAVYGMAVPQHVSSNLAFGWAHYAATRAEILDLLLLPASSRTLFMTVAIAVAALALAARAGPSLLHGWLAPGGTARVYGCHAVVLLLALIAVGVPAWRYTVERVPLFTAFNMTSLAHTWPFVFAGVYVLVLPAAGVSRQIERYLLHVTGVFIVGTLVVMPHAGGTQWGPRFLLPAAPLAGVIASEALGRFDAAPFQAISIRAMAAAVLALSVIVQGLGLVVLAHDKAAHATIGRVTERLTEPGDVIVSDLSWFPELTSRLYPSRRLLFARSAGDLTAIANLAATRGLRRMMIVTSVAETQNEPPKSLGLHDGGRFVQTVTHDIGVRGLRLYLYER